MLAATALPFLLISAAFADSDAVRPLPQAHAHNDYWHDRPLFDALERGFGSVEADIWLKDGKLLVGHEAAELDPAKTLQSLYLEPLRLRALATDCRLDPPLTLLVDVKTAAGPTYAALDALLAEYPDILSSTENGRFTRRAVTIVLSGNRDQETIRGQAKRFVGIDGRATDLDRDDPADLLPWISANWTERFRWRGDGPMPDAEREKLRAYVAKAHAHGRKVRFWATPENESVWSELLAAGVDLIGTDDLDRLRACLVERKVF